MMITKHYNHYKKGDVEDFFREFVEKLNLISENPLNADIDERVRIPFFPLTWDLSQFYLAFKDMYKIKLFDNMAFIITNRDYSSIHEIFMFEFIETDEEEAGTGEQRYKFQIISFDIEKHAKNFFELNELVANFDVQIFKKMEYFLKKEYQFRIGQLFILREGIANVGILKETDYINSDVVRYLKDFFLLMRKGLKKNILQKMPVIEYSSKENRSNPIVNFFIRFGKEWAEVSINKFLDFVTKILDNTSTNLLILNNDEKPLCICRATISNGIIHFNPVPLHFLKDYLSVHVECNEDELTKKLYDKTKVKTICFKLGEVTELLYKINDPNYCFAEFVVDGLQFLSTNNMFPESTLHQILSEGLGVDSKLIMNHLKTGFVKFIQYYEQILVAVLKTKRTGWKNLDNLFSIGADCEGKLCFKQYPLIQYSSIFNQRNTTDAIDLLHLKITQDTGTEFPMILGMKLNPFTEIFSAKNIQSLLEMTNFMNSLPSLERVSTFMNLLSQNHEEYDTLEEEIENNHICDPLEKKGVLDGIPSLNYFLNKGIIIKISENKSFMTKRNKEFKKNGYLGLDLKKIKEFVDENFPEILKKEL